MKQDMYSAAELQLKRVQAMAKSPIAAAQAQKGIDALRYQKQKDAATVQVALAKAGKDKGLDASGKVRYDAAKEALDNVRKMKKILFNGKSRTGANTFSVVGDNDYTLAQNKFAENYGRMQSGGVVGDEERKEFKGFTPGVKDTAKMQLSKLDTLEQELIGRLQTLGKGDPDAVNDVWAKYRKN